MTIDPNSLIGKAGMSEMEIQQARANAILADFAAGFNGTMTELPSPADDGASDEDKATEPGWHRHQREDDKAEKADQDDDERRIGS